MEFEKKTTTFFDRLCVFFHGSSETQLTRSFSWPYVDPPSKSATASNNKSSDDDAIEIETLKLLKKKKKKLTTGHNDHLILQKYQKQNSWLYFNPSKDGYICMIQLSHNTHE